MMSKLQRRRLRTLVLAVVATAALFWGAVEIAGVPAVNLWRHIGATVLALLCIMVIALAGAGVLSLRHRRRHRERESSGS